MRKYIDWKRPVETVSGLRLTVVRPGYVKGLPSDAVAGRKPGIKMEWKYSATGNGGVPFLPEIRNVEGM